MPKLTYFEIHDNGKLIGTVKLDNQTEEILSLHVDKAYRRKKKATQLIKQLELHAETKGLRRIFATVTETNIVSASLFEKLGYRKLLKFEKLLKRKTKKEGP